MKNTEKLSNFIKQEYTFCLVNELQRPYEWKENLVKDFIHDIFNKDENYFIGNFLTYNNKEDRKKYIFDGQQRLTTLTLLLKAIEKRCKDEEIKLSKIWINFIENSIYEPREYDDYNRKLILRDDDDEYLNNIIKDNIDKSEKKHMYKIYTLILDYVNELSEEDYQTLIEKTYHLNCIELTCDSYDEGIEQFNKLNSGQQSLTKERNLSSLFFTCCRDYINNEKYSDTYSKISYLPDNDLKRFFGLFSWFNYKEKFSEVNFNSLEEDLKKKKLKICDKICDFYSKYWEPLYNEEFNGNESFLNFSFGHGFGKDAPLQMTIIFLLNHYENKIFNEKEVENYYKFMEYILICNRVIDSTRPAQKFSEYFNSYRSSENFIKHIKNKAKNIYHEIDNLFDIIDNDKKEKGPKNPIYITFLKRAEYIYRKEKNSFDNIDLKNITLEHIFPQKRNEKFNYDYDLNNFIYNIGNLTLLNGKANSSIKNKPFDLKKEQYEISPILITKRISGYNKWDLSSLNANEKFLKDKIKEFYNVNE